MKLHVHDCNSGSQRIMVGGLVRGCDLSTRNQNVNINKYGSKTPHVWSRAKQVKEMVSPQELYMVC